MFLNELKKEEALSFLNLVNIFSKVDNVLAKEEKELIKDYVEELGLQEEQLGNVSYEEVLANLKNSTDRVKRIIYFELIGLALVDGEYEENEVDFLDKLALELNIPRDKRIAFANYFFNFKEVYDFSVVEAEDKLVLLKEQAEALL
ncbi:MAG: hypothetical protein ACRC2K_11010 [Clostridium sp.]